MIEPLIQRGKSMFRRDQQLPNLARIPLPAQRARTPEWKNPSILSPFSDCSDERGNGGGDGRGDRRNIVINNPFWLVFAGAPDRRSSPLPRLRAIYYRGPPARHRSSIVDHGSRSFFLIPPENHFDLCCSVSVNFYGQFPSPLLSRTVIF